MRNSSELLSRITSIFLTLNFRSFFSSYILRPFLFRSYRAKLHGILIPNEKHKVGQRPEGTIIVVGTDPRGNLNTGKKLSNREVLISLLLN